MFVQFSKEPNFGGLVNFTANSTLYAVAGYLTAKVATAALLTLGFSAKATALVTFVPKVIFLLGAAGATAGCVCCLVVFTATIILSMTAKVAGQ